MPLGLWIPLGHEACDSRVFQLRNHWTITAQFASWTGGVLVTFGLEVNSHCFLGNF